MEENNIITVQERKQLELLNNGLIMADRFINKNYLIDLPKKSVLKIDEKFKNNNAIRLFCVEKLVFDKEENANDKLISVYSALQEIDSAVLLLISGTESDIQIYLGIRSYENASTASKILEKGMKGNFPGSKIKSLKNSEIRNIMDGIALSKYVNMPKNISSVTVVPSTRDEDKEKFVQGIEKFIDAMQGETYTALFIANPVSKAQLEEQKRGYEELYSSLSPFIKTTLAYGDNYSKAVTKGMFENFSHSINNSIANTTGRNSGINSSVTHGRNTNFNMGGNGGGMSTGTSKSKTSGYSSGQSWSKAVTEGTADTTGTGTNDSDTITEGTSRTLTVEHQNKSVAVLLDTIDAHLERIKACEAFGVWECAGYFIADDVQTSVVAANTYKALMIGDDTYVENAFINTWGIQSQEQIGELMEYMKYAQHPVIEIPAEDGFEEQYITPANYISGREMTLLQGLPQSSVSGITVSNIAEFGRNVYVQDRKTDEKTISIGKVYHMGNTEKQDVNLSLESFTSHCFITGSTGSGKSNTTYGLLEEFYKNEIPFLVIEPAKGEYKNAFGGIEGINIFTTNPYIEQMLKLNPFRFEPEIHILEHLDRLVEIFNACWEMYAAMPAILKDAMERIYIEKGWDLLNSVYMKGGEPKYPTFQDLLQTLPTVIQSSGYSADTKGDYTGALVTRVASLTNGITGQIFCDSYDIPESVLFDQNTIVDLSRVGSTETKSLLMGILVLKLSEYRMAKSTGANQPLRHITVMEEAHNLLKRTSGTQGQETANLIGKSVEMICNSIAEMRTFGEGFIIVDQSPTAVDIAAIKNTNTKIVMRLPEQVDCEAVGHAMSLNEEQVKELAKLPTGVGAVIQNDWLETVLVKINKASSSYQKETKPISYEVLKQLRGTAASILIRQYYGDRLWNKNEFKEAFNNISSPDSKKKELLESIYSLIDKTSEKRDISLFSNVLKNISGCNGVFDVCESQLQYVNLNLRTQFDYDELSKWKTLVQRCIAETITIDSNKIDLFTRTLIYNMSTSPCRDNRYSTIYKMLYDETFQLQDKTVESSNITKGKIR